MYILEEIMDTLDLSNRKLKKLCKPAPNESQVKNLILDDNELQRLDNIDSFTKVEKVCISLFVLIALSHYVSISISLTNVVFYLKII